MKQFIKELNRFCTFKFKQFCIRLNKNYLKNRLAKRIGKCKRCGKCCEGCSFLDKQTRLCTIYENRPGSFCYRDLPLSRRDQKVWGVEKVCGYSFKE